MNLDWQEWIILALCLILLFSPGICFWWAGHVWEKHNKKRLKEDEPDTEFPGGQINDSDMAKRRKYKIGDRIFYEHFDRTVGTAIVLEIKPESYIDDNGKTINYDMLIIWKSGNCTSGIEDYNTLPYSDPRVKVLLQELKKQDSLAQDIRDWIINKGKTYPGYYDPETIAAALGQVAKEYGYKEE